MRGRGGSSCCAPPREAPDVTVVHGRQRRRAAARAPDRLERVDHGALPRRRSLKILHDAFGVERAFFTTVHAYTASSAWPTSPPRTRAAGGRRPRTSSRRRRDSAAMVMELLPELAGRRHGLAINVPVPNGSVVDLVCWHERR